MILNVDLHLKVCKTWLYPRHHNQVRDQGNRGLSKNKEIKNTVINIIVNNNIPNNKRNNDRHLKLKPWCEKRQLMAGGEEEQREKMEGV